MIVSSAEAMLAQAVGFHVLCTLEHGQVDPRGPSEQILGQREMAATD